MTQLPVFFRCLWMGLSAGFVWSVLQPVRQKHPVLWQMLCCTALTAFWTVTVFGICRADPRPGLLLGCAAGFFLWLKTAAPGTEAVFFGIRNLFAQFFRRIMGPFLFIFHKLAFFRKYLFPRRGK